MWFKNINAHRVSGEAITYSELDAALGRKPFKECDKHQQCSSGWISPFGEHSKYLTPGTMGAHLLCLKVETRKVPSSAIKAELQKEVTRRKSQDPDFTLTRKLKTELCEQIHTSLLPRAFSKFDIIFAYWDLRRELLVVDTSSKARAQMFVEALLAALTDKDIKIRNLQSVRQPSAVMSVWLKDGDHPNKLNPGEAVTIRNTKDEDKGSIKYKKQDLTEDDRLKGYLGEWRTVQDLDVQYGQDMTFCLTEQMLVKAIKWSDELAAEADGDAAPGESDEIMASFALMSSKATELIEYLVEDCFGGELQEDQDSTSLNADAAIDGATGAQQSL